MLSAWSPLKERRTPINKKFEITDIAHETYPFLHRIRALQDIGNQVRAGDLGGFVEHEGNLSRDVADTAWIFDDAIAAGNARVDSGAQLRDYALACDNAHVSNGAVMSGNSRAEDNAYLRGAVLKDSARASGESMILDATGEGRLFPVLSGNSAVYGKVQGSIHVRDSVLIFSNEDYQNESTDTFVLDRNGRSILRDPAREILTPLIPQNEPVRTPSKSVRKTRGTSR